MILYNTIKFNNHLFVISTYIIKYYPKFHSNQQRTQNKGPENVRLLFLFFFWGVGGFIWVKRRKRRFFLCVGKTKGLERYVFFFSSSFFFVLFLFFYSSSLFLLMRRRILLLFFFFLISKQSKYIKSAWKKRTTYTRSIQVAAENKQRERETTNQHSKLKVSP